MLLVDLFAGIGGFSLAGHCVGWETLMFCENASYPKKVLNKNFPGILIHDDIKTLTKEIIEKEFIKKYGYYDPNELIFTAGVPCQPASQAGKRKGTKDHRWLWYPTIRIVREVKPSFVICENVTGLLSLENGKPFEGILTSLEAEGYTVESFIIPACGVGAWHRRDRVWIISYNSNFSRMDREFIKNSMDRGQQTFNEITSGSKSGKDVPDTESTKRKQSSVTRTGRNGFTNSCKNVPNSDKLNDDNSGHGTGKISQFKTSRLSGLQYWKSEPELGRVAARIPNRVERLKGIGNAIVPQVAFEIFKIINTF